MLRAALIALTISLAGMAPAQTGASDPEIESVIQGQIDALKADDFETAFSFASPSIKRIFGTPDRFGTMVEQGYPMIIAPGEVKFLELRQIAGSLWQKVLVRDAKGAFFLLDYQMLPGEGGWQIDGVQLLQAEQLGA